MELKKMLITPEIATRILAKNTFRNRSIKRGWIKDLAEQMKNGEWNPETGETIKFNQDNQLVDGQNRLHAIILANISVYMYVTYGVSNDSFSYIDQGVKRSAGDTLQALGIKSAAAIAAIIKASIALSRSKVSNPVKDYSKRASNIQVQIIYLSKPEYWDELRRQVSKYYMAFGVGILSESFIGAWVDIFNTIDEDDSELFWQYFSSGEGKVTDVTFQLKNIFVKDALNRHQNMTSRKKQAILIKAWNAFRSGKEVKQLRWHASEPFPEII